MAGSSVQFRQADQVIDAYRKCEVAPWAIQVSGCKDIFMGYEGDDIETGADQLQTALDMIKDGGGEGRYFLKVYILKKGERILSNTPAYRGFQFNLYNDREIEGLQPYQVRRETLSREFDEKIGRLEERIMSKLSRVEEDEEKPRSGIIGMFHGLLDRPDVQQAIASRVLGLVDRFLPMGGAAKVAGHENGVASEAPVNLLDQAQVDKVNQALVVLCSIDDKLGDHLLRIAEIARNTPSKYKMYLTML